MQVWPKPNFTSKSDKNIKKKGFLAENKKGVVLRKCYQKLRKM